MLSVGLQSFIYSKWAHNTEKKGNAPSRSGHRWTGTTRRGGIRRHGGGAAMARPALATSPAVALAHGAREAAVATLRRGRGQGKG